MDGIKHISFKLYFLIDNAHIINKVHPNIFITPFDVEITRIRQIAVELKAHALLVLIVVILRLMKNVFGFE
jgi:hypothetical protein